VKDVVRKALATAAGLLALFHVWLFADQLRRGDLLTDPGLLARWLIAIGLVGALVALRRHGVSLVVGRKAVAIWALAALLHGPAIAGRLDALGETTVSETVVMLARIAATSMAGVWLLRLAFVTRRHALAVNQDELAAAIDLDRPALDPRPLIAPRPPPLS
jgi:hypothetical protein